MDLSIVIPVYNEARKIGRDIAAAAEFLLSAGLRGEVLIVDDGSSDGSATAAFEQPMPPGVERRIIRLPLNKGKGAAVRAGVLASQGLLVMFADSGHCIDYAQARAGMALVQDGLCAVAHGSRHMPGSVITVPKPWVRTLGSDFFRLAVRSWLKIPDHLTDTQCGFKIYRGDTARQLYRELQTEGFAFDVEIILRARRRGYRIAEFPVVWHRDPDSRVLPWRMGLQIFSQLYRIRRMMRLEPLALTVDPVMNTAASFNDPARPS